MRFQLYYFVQFVRTVGLTSWRQKTILSKMVSGRITPSKLKIDTSKFKSLLTPELNKLHELFKKNGFELRMAGGAVRDLLMDITPSDIDFATTATPDQMKEMFAREGIRMLNKKGEEHGTITCRIDDKANFEVTTLRVDVVCDGRRAKVEYTTDWQLDANRRDLTVNSLFLDFDGTVIDYFNGINDVERRLVTFVGDAAQRIQEDYLRILRYFRFFGRLASSGEAHDRRTLEAITRNRNGLMDVSGERICSELKKICTGRLGGDVVKVMLESCGLGPFLGLPETANTRHFREMHSRYYPSIEAMTLISSLLNNEMDVYIFHMRCKISYADKALTEFITEMRSEAEKNAASVTFFKNLILDEERMHKFTRKKSQSGCEKVEELCKYVFANECVVNELKTWKSPTFPIGGIDLMNRQIPSGPIVREILDHLYNLWKESNWTMNKDDLLEHINDIDLSDYTSGRLASKRKRILSYTEQEDKNS